MTAELTDLAMMSEQEMRIYEPLLSGRAADEYRAGTLRATFTVVESSDPLIGVGHVAVELISTGGKTHEVVRRGFDSCKGPTERGRFAKALGMSATCNGLPTGY